MGHSIIKKLLEVQRKVLSIKDIVRIFSFVPCFYFIRNTQICTLRNTLSFMILLLKKLLSIKITIELRCDSSYYGEDKFLKVRFNILRSYGLLFVMLKTTL